MTYCVLGTVLGTGGYICVQARVGQEGFLGVLGSRMHWNWCQVRTNGMEKHG